MLVGKLFNENDVCILQCKSTFLFELETRLRNNLENYIRDCNRFNVEFVHYEITRNGNIIKEYFAYD